MISVIIPTLNAENYIVKLIESLKGQEISGAWHDVNKSQPGSTDSTCNGQQGNSREHGSGKEPDCSKEPDSSKETDTGSNDAQSTAAQLEIIVIDSESTDSTAKLASEAGAKVINIKRKDFDHGGTRNLGWQTAKGDIICFLTQDALPADSHYFEKLTEGFSNPQVMMISGRQIPRPDARPVERLTRLFNYPETTFTRDASDIPRLGIKAYFFSDACSAYRRSILEEMGGFECPINTNEDMLMAARVLNKGYKIGYAGTAGVYHSHNFTLKQQYRRNREVAMFLDRYSDEIQTGGTTGEGVRMVLYTLKELLKGFHIGSCFRCISESLAKYLGNRAGHRAYKKKEA